MRWERTRYWVTASLAVLPVACSEPTGFAAECTDATTTVNATVTTVGNVVVDWSPRCPVAVVLFEEGDSDAWGISGPLGGQSPGAANTILPPVVYGQVPGGAEEVRTPLTLTRGETYEVILWRALPEGSTLACADNIGNLCMVALREFTR